MEGHFSMLVTQDMRGDANHLLPRPRRHLTQDDWETLRPLITKWYKNHTAKQVVSELKYHDILATEKMVRDRLKRWSQNVKNKRPIRQFRNNTSPQSHSRTSMEISSGDTPGLLLTPSSESSFISSASYDAATPPEGIPSLLPPVTAHIGMAPSWERMPVPRPLPTPPDEVPQRQAMAGMYDWFKFFLESANAGLKGLNSGSTMLLLMNTFQEAFYLIDTGAAGDGYNILKEAGETVPRVLREEHPMAFLHAIQGLTTRRLSSQKADPNLNDYQEYELVVMLDGRLRVIECDNCDAPIVDSHFHCRSCSAGHYDICLACVDKGAHCLNGNHRLVKRLIEDGKVVETILDPLPPLAMRMQRCSLYSSTQRISGMLPRRPLLYASETGTSCEVLPKVCSFLLEAAKDILGICHPMTLLLGMFQTPADMETLRHHILALMDNTFIRWMAMGGSCVSQLQPAYGWILFQHGRYEALEHLINLHGFHNADSLVKAEKMRLLAAVRIDQGRCDEAAILYRRALTTLYEANQENTPQADKVLHDSATLSWQMGNWAECNVAIDLAWKRLQSVERASPKDRRYVLTFCNMIYFRCGKYKEAAALRKANPDVFEV